MKASNLALEIVEDLKIISEYNPSLAPEKYINSRYELLNEMEKNNTLQEDQMIQFDIFKFLKNP